ncbi:MAG TPA: DUF6085 family protein, partial [Actinomycetota bacterium]|nr:DUF6085 family protein [Actinomycetota bacterium]
FGVGGMTGARNREWGNNDVKGYCPACRNSTLFVAMGGYITCSWLACPNPTAVSDLLDATWHDLEVGT